MHEHTVVFQAFVAFSINTIYDHMTLLRWVSPSDWRYHQLMFIDSTSSFEHPADRECSINSSVLCPSQLHTLIYYITLHSRARHVIQDTPPSFSLPVHSCHKQGRYSTTSVLSDDIRVTGHAHRLHRFSFTSVVFHSWAWLTTKEATFQISAETAKDSVTWTAQKASLHSKVPQQVL